MQVDRLLYLSLSLLLISSMAPGQQPDKAAVPARTIIHAGHVLDVRTGNEAANQAIVIAGDRIVSVGPDQRALPGDKEIDLSTMTVMPGLIDVHTHLTMDTNFDPYHELTTTPIKEALIGVRNARTTLEAGFTSVRNVGASGYSDVALRDEINAGNLPGPHMQVSGPPLGITGGHCDDNLLPFEYHVTADGVADGVAAVQQKVRQNIKYGVDLIKVCATGGVLSKGDDPQASQYTQEELRAIVADAHRLGRKVAAHAHGSQGALWASEAGVDSIEHGSYIDDATIAVMKKNGTYLVPTAFLRTWLPVYGKLPAIYAQKAKDVSAVSFANNRKAIREGVKIALGTDAAVYPHGMNAHELDVYVNDLGMKPLAAIQSATVNAADLMGWTDRAGSLEPGKWADIIAVPGDPLMDVKILQNVPFVMKSGVVYKNEAAKR
jgi:imidazolonepropionase-like amidohydrolase